MNRGVCPLPLLFFTLSPPQTKSKKQKQSHHRHARTTEYNVRKKSPRPSPPPASKQASPRPHIPLFLPPLSNPKSMHPQLQNTRSPLLSSLFPLSYSPYSTVTDFAKFLGISTFNPSATANQYAINCSGITFSRPCRQSTVFGISIFSHLSSRNSSSSGLQMTIGLPERAMTA